MRARSIADATDWRSVEPRKNGMPSNEADVLRHDGARGRRSRRGARRGWHHSRSTRHATRSARNTTRSHHRHPGRSPRNTARSHWHARRTAGYSTRSHHRHPSRSTRNSARCHRHARRTARNSTWGHHRHARRTAGNTTWGHRHTCRTARNATWGHRHACRTTGNSTWGHRHACGAAWDSAGRINPGDCRCHRHARSTRSTAVRSSHAWIRRIDTRRHAASRWCGWGRRILCGVRVPVRERAVLIHFRLQQHPAGRQCHERDGQHHRVDAEALLLRRRRRASPALL